MTPKQIIMAAFVDELEKVSQASGRNRAVESKRRLDKPFNKMMSTPNIPIMGGAGLRGHAFTRMNQGTGGRVRRSTTPAPNTAGIGTYPTR